MTTHGISLEPTPSYRPDKDRVAERVNRTLITRMRVTLIESQLLKKIWPLVLEYQTLIKNCVPTCAIAHSVPITFWTNKKPDVSIIHRFGCNIIVHIPQEKRVKLVKFDTVGTTGKFVGYEHTNVKIWTGEKVIISTDIKFLEGIKYLAPTQTDMDSIHVHELEYLDGEWAGEEISEDKTAHTGAAGNDSDNRKPEVTFSDVSQAEIQADWLDVTQEEGLDNDILFDNINIRSTRSSRKTKPPSARDLTTDPRPSRNQNLFKHLQGNNVNITDKKSVIPKKPTLLGLSLSNMMIVEPPQELPERYANFIITDEAITHAYMAFKDMVLYNNGNPITRAQAMSAPDSEQWFMAEKTEIKELIDRNT